MIAAGEKMPVRKANRLKAYGRQNGSECGDVSTLKRFSDRRCGTSLWQRSSYDRVIRSEKEYLACWNYIDGNPSRWQDDEYFENK